MSKKMMYRGLYVIKTSSGMVGSFPLVSLSSDGPLGDLAGSYLFGDHLGHLSSSCRILTGRETGVNIYAETCSTMKIISRCNSRIFKIVQRKDSDLSSDVFNVKL